LFIVAWFADPRMSGWLPKCPLHELTGLYCPGCGLTRAAYHLAHGHARAALAMDPLIIVLAAIAAYVFVCELLNALGRQIRYPRFIYRWHWAFWALIAGFGVARNIHTYPFCILAPH
jgi:hypothetical protein